MSTLCTLHPISPRGSSAENPSTVSQLGCCRRCLQESSVSITTRDASFWKGGFHLRKKVGPGGPGGPREGWLPALLASWGWAVWEEVAVKAGQGQCQVSRNAQTATVAQAGTDTDPVPGITHRPGHKPNPFLGKAENINARCAPEK